MKRRRTHCIAFALALGLIMGPATARSQSLGVEPGEVRPTLPAPETGAGPNVQLDLPPLDATTEPESLAVPIDRIVVTGSTVFNAHEIASVLEPFTGRGLTSSDLIAARDALTQLYVDHGYVTSGAVIPDQAVEQGTIRLHVVEGDVGEIEIEGNHRIRDAYLRPRLERASRAPVQLGRLREALRILQQEPSIERIDAHLEPGARRGESRLVVSVREAAQWALGLEVANDKSPTVGSTGVIVDGRTSNLAGLNDAYRARFQVTPGYRDIDVRFEIPINRYDTTFRFEFRDTQIEIVEAPFEVLDIEADGRSFSLALFHPLWRAGPHALWAELRADHRRTSSKVLGLPFCFELALLDCDEPTIAALRGGLQYTFAARRDVVSARALFSGGLPVLGATTGAPPGTPDGQFFAWLGQAQWAHVLADRWLDSTLLFRGDVQLANQPLLAIEKIAMGGRRTVRGYRENQMVRDNGAVLSGEVRVPVWRSSLKRPIVEVVPFMDWAYGWDQALDPPENQLWSVGIGLRVMPRPGLLGEFYWGNRIDSARTRTSDAQDYGINFRVRVDAPEVF